MKRIHFCGIVLLFFVFCSHHLQAKPSITVIKGMTELFEGHEDASPLLGCLAWESQWIENIYRFWKDSGKKQASSSIQQLVTELFYLQPDTVTFGPTVKGLNIAAHFNAKTIGALLATIEQFHESQKEQSKINVEKKRKREDDENQTSQKELKETLYRTKTTGEKRTFEKVDTDDDDTIKSKKVKTIPLKQELIDDLTRAITNNLNDYQKINKKLEYDFNAYEKYWNQEWDEVDKLKDKNRDLPKERAKQDHYIKNQKLNTFGDDFSRVFGKIYIKMQRGQLPKMLTDEQVINLYNIVKDNDELIKTLHNEAKELNESFGITTFFRKKIDAVLENIKIEKNIETVTLKINELENQKHEANSNAIKTFGTRFTNTFWTFYDKEELGNPSKPFLPKRSFRESQIKELQDEASPYNQNFKDETVFKQRLKAFLEEFKGINELRALQLELVTLKELKQKRELKPNAGVIKIFGIKFTETLWDIYTKKQLDQPVKSFTDEQAQPWVNQLQNVAIKHNQDFKDTTLFKKKFDGLLENYNELTKLDHQIKSKVYTKQQQPHLKKIGFYKEMMKKINRADQEPKAFIQGKAQKLASVIAEILLPEKHTDANQFFDKLALNRVLLAWLWVSSSNKQNFFDYYKAFITKLGLEVNDIEFKVDENFNLVAFNKKEEVYDKQEGYNKNDYFDLLKIYTETFDTDDDKAKKQREALLKKPALFEELLFLYFGFDLFQNPYPPHVKGSQVIVKANNQTYNFPDCGETSLRNFFNMLLWNANNRKFDTNILKNSFSQCDKNLINFYTQNSDALNLELPTLYNAWATLCSKIPNVTYGDTDICNIRGTGVTNISRVIAYLLGIDISNSDANKIAPFVFKTITKNLEKNKITFQCSPDFEDTLDKEADVVYSFDISSSKVVAKKLTWQFMLGHYVAFFDSKATMRSNIPLYTYCEKNIAVAHQLLPMTILNATVDSAIKGINDIFTLNKLKSHVSFVLYSNNDYVKMFVKMVLKNKDFDANAYSQLDNSNFLGSIQDPNLRYVANIEAIEKYPNLLPKCLNRALKNEYDDSNIVGYALKIIENKIQSLYGIINYWLKNLQNERSKGRIMVAIINSKTTDLTLTSAVKDNLSSINDESIKSDIMRAIIESKTTDLTLTDYVKDNLSSITSEYYRSNIMVTIIKLKTTDSTLTSAVKDNLSSINYEPLKRDVMVAIIEFKTTDLTLTSAVKDNLSSLKNEYYKNDVMLAIIESKTTDLILISCIKDNLSSLKDESYKTGIIKTIIYSKTTDLILISAVKDNLSSIKDEALKMEIMVAIIKTKTTDLILIAYVKDNLSSITREYCKKDNMVAIINSKTTDLILIAYVKDNLSSISYEDHKKEITRAVKSLDESELKNELLELMKQLGWE